jgi:hypothetical protein
MNLQSTKAIPRFLEILGLAEEPMGILYTDEKPGEGFSPKPLDLPTREKTEKEAKRRKRKQLEKQNAEATADGLEPGQAPA